MNVEKIFRIAMEQSAEDIGCNPEDFMRAENVIVPFCLGKGARKYLKAPIAADFVSCGNNRERFRFTARPGQIFVQSKTP